MREYLGELILGTAPASEPLTTAEAKAHLRVDISDDDTFIGNLVSAARRTFEQINGRTLFTTTWKLILDGWPDSSHLDLPRPPLASVTSVAYVDSDGNNNTFDSANYVVETERTPGRISLGYGKSWPTATLRPASPITITYVAGYTTVADIPQEYKQAMLLLIGHWYENRENVTLIPGHLPKSLPLAFESLAKLDRVY